jgi:hypothetical protein
MKVGLSICLTSANEPPIDEPTIDPSVLDDSSMKKNLVNKNQGCEPIHQKYKAKENTSGHNPSEVAAATEFMNDGHDES